MLEEPLASPIVPSDSHKNRNATGVKAVEAHREQGDSLHYQHKEAQYDNQQRTSNVVHPAPELSTTQGRSYNHSKTVGLKKPLPNVMLYPEEDAGYFHGNDVSYVENPVQPEYGVKEAVELPREDPAHFRSVVQDLSEVPVETFKQHPSRDLRPALAESARTVLVTTGLEDMKAKASRSNVNNLQQHELKDPYLQVYSFLTSIYQDCDQRLVRNPDIAGDAYFGTPTDNQARTRAVSADEQNMFVYGDA
ncbi:hypothetical protein EDD11_000372 [Mortierella claussenii]|nr:hypothetical protein EDD11_000372 [Mortierella claussenii]